jgi:tetratricopeptide (TPR) repeat protein
VADGLVSHKLYSSPELRFTEQKAAEQDAARALALDSHQARAWVARALVAQGLDEWLRRNADLDKALAIDPDEPLALYARGDALAQIGRIQDTLAARRRAVNSDPLSPTYWAELAQAEAYSGDLAGAYATLDDAERRWPGHPDIVENRLYIVARVGDPALAQQLLKQRLTDESPLRTYLTSVRADYFRLLIAARADPRRADEAAAYMLAHAGKDLSLHDAVQGLVGVGHVDQALDLVRNNIPEIAHQRNQMDGFFRPFMARFLASPRFMPLAARIGLVDIWRRSGLWPDFCTAPDRPYDCKAEARKLAKS